MSGGENLPIIIPLLVDKDGASVDELDDHVLLLEAARHRLEVEWTESLGVFEAREGHEVFGYPSLVAYLKDRARMAGSRANRYVSLARAARRFKATLVSWRHRQISSDQAEMLFRAAQQLADKYPDAEPVLLELSATLQRKRRRFWTIGAARWIGPVWWPMPRCRWTGGVSTTTASPMGWLKASSL